MTKVARVPMARILIRYARVTAGQLAFHFVKIAALTLTVSELVVDRGENFKGNAAQTLRQFRSLRSYDRAIQIYIFM